MTLCSKLLEKSIIKASANFNLLLVLLIISLSRKNRRSRNMESNTRNSFIKKILRQSAVLASRFSFLIFKFPTSTNSNLKFKDLLFGLKKITFMMTRNRCLLFVPRKRKKNLIISKKLVFRLTLP